MKMIAAGLHLQLFIKFPLIYQCFCCLPDANRVFNQVIRSLNINDEKLQSFRLSVESAATKQSATSGTQKTKQNGWNIMSINYKPDWPLHVFFTSLALER